MITLQFATVNQMRAEVTALLGVPLVAAQAPTPHAKEAIADQEARNALEQTLADTQYLLEEAKEELERLRPVVTELASVKADRDDLRQRVDAQSVEMKRLQNLVGVENAYPARQEEEKPKPKRTRKAPQREGGSLDMPDGPGPESLDHEAELAMIQKADIQPIAGSPGDVFARFEALPLTGPIPGQHILVYLDDEQQIVEGWANRQFEGTDRWDVKLKRGGYAVVPAPRARDFAKGFDDSPRDFIEEALQKQRLGTPGVDRENPTPPKFIEGTDGDGVVDRLVTHEERAELAAKAQDLKITPDRMVMLMQREFDKSKSAELTVAEMHTLLGVMETDAKVPF